MRQPSSLLPALRPSNSERPPRQLAITQTTHTTSHRVVRYLGIFPRTPMLHLVETGCRKAVPERIPTDVALIQVRERRVLPQARSVVGFTTVTDGLSRTLVTIDDTVGRSQGGKQDSLVRCVASTSHAKQHGRPTLTSKGASSSITMPTAYLSSGSGILRSRCMQLVTLKTSSTSSVRMIKSTFALRRDSQCVPRQGSLGLTSIMLFRCSGKTIPSTSFSSCRVPPPESLCASQ